MRRNLVLICGIFLFLAGVAAGQDVRPAFDVTCRRELEVARWERGPQPMHAITRCLAGSRTRLPVPS